MQARAIAKAKAEAEAAAALKAKQEGEAAEAARVAAAEAAAAQAKEAADIAAAAAAEAEKTKSVASLDRPAAKGNAKAHLYSDEPEEALELDENHEAAIAPVRVLTTANNKIVTHHRVNGCSLL